MNKLKELAQAIQKNPINGKITPKVSGIWLFGKDDPQFRSVIEVEGRSFTVEADMPSKLGGWSLRPGPLHYCLYGLASCYAFTLAALAAMEGVTLKKLQVDVESHMDVSKVLGLSDKPIIEEVKFKLTAESDAEKEKIEKLKKLAEERCPAMYCLKNPIKVKVDLAT